MKSYSSRHTEIIIDSKRVEIDFKTLHEVAANAVYFSHYHAEDVDRSIQHKLAHDQTLTESEVNNYLRATTAYAQAVLVYSALKHAESREELNVTDKPLKI